MAGGEWREEEVRAWEQGYKWVYYTDGSCEQGVREGRAGAGFFWRGKNGEEGRQGWRVSRMRGPYRAEMAAMEGALDHTKPKW